VLKTVALLLAVIVVGPDATDRAGWQVPQDGPTMLYFLIGAVKTKHASTAGGCISSAILPARH